MATTTDRQTSPTTETLNTDATNGRRRPGSASPGAGSRIGRVLLGVLALGAVAGLVAVAWPQVSSSFTSSEEKSGALTHPVSRQTMRITVTEDGTVESGSNEEVKCRVKGGSTILWIVEDGTIVEGPVKARINGTVEQIDQRDGGAVAIAVRSEDGEIVEHLADFGEDTFVLAVVGAEVQEGDDLAGRKIVELDPSTIEDELTQQQITYENARSTWLQAKEGYEAAKIGVKEYEEGTYLQEMQNLEASIRIAEENLTTAQNVLEHTKVMARKGFATPLQLQADKFAVERAELELASAKTAKKVLQEFTKEKTLTELRSARDQAEAQMKAAEATLTLEESRLRQLEEQLANCVLYAPKGGMIVYANEERRRSQDISIEEGAQVREQQVIVRIPDLTRMQVNAAIHESKIYQIEPGMPAEISIRDQQMKGTVKSVANRAEATNWFSPDVKEYETIVQIDKETTTLKPGMSAVVEIEVAEITDDPLTPEKDDGVLVVPVQCVVELGGYFYCWVQTEQGLQRRPVKLGRTNDKMIWIKDGIKEGERVLLNPRTHIAEARREGLDKRGSESEAGPPEAERPAAGPPGPSGSKAGSPSGGGPGAGASGEGGPGGGGGGLITRLDTDGDGKVSKDEAPERMQEFFDRLDSDGDGFIDRGEAAAAARRRQQQQSGPGQPGSQGPSPGGQP